MNAFMKRETFVPSGTSRGAPDKRLPPIPNEPQPIEPGSQPAAQPAAVPAPAQAPAADPATEGLVSSTGGADTTPKAENRTPSPEESAKALLACTPEEAAALLLGMPENGRKTLIAAARAADEGKTAQIMDLFRQLAAQGQAVDLFIADESTQANTLADLRAKLPTVHATVIGMLQAFRENPDALVKQLRKRTLPQQASYIEALKKRDETYGLLVQEALNGKA